MSLGKGRGSGGVRLIPGGGNREEDRPDEAGREMRLWGEVARDLGRWPEAGSTFGIRLGLCGKDLAKLGRRGALGEELGWDLGEGHRTGRDLGRVRWNLDKVEMVLVGGPDLHYSICCMIV